MRLKLKTVRWWREGTWFPGWCASGFTVACEWFCFLLLSIDLSPLHFFVFLEDLIFFFLLFNLLSSPLLVGLVSFPSCLLFDKPRNWKQLQHQQGLYVMEKQVFRFIPLSVWDVAPPGFFFLISRYTFSWRAVVIHHEILRSILVVKNSSLLLNIGRSTSSAQCKKKIFGSLLPFFPLNLVPLVLPIKFTLGFYLLFYVKYSCLSGSCYYLKPAKFQFFT